MILLPYWKLTDDWTLLFRAPKKYRAVSVRTNDPVTPYKIKLERIKQHADLSYINEALDNSSSSSLSLSSQGIPKYVDSRQITAPPIPTYGNTMQVRGINMYYLWSYLDITRRPTHHYASLYRITSDSSDPLLIRTHPQLSLSPGVSNCRNVAPARDRAFKTCDKPTIPSTV